MKPNIPALRHPLVNIIGKYLSIPKRGPVAEPR